MEEVLASGQLTREEIRTIRSQFEQAKESQQLLDEVRGFKRRRTTSNHEHNNIDDSNSESDGDQSQQSKSFDLKYKNVETLRIISSLRELLLLSCIAKTLRSVFYTHPQPAVENTEMLATTPASVRSSSSSGSDSGSQASESSTTSTPGPSRRIFYTEEHRLAIM
ncbi:hypothetical protein V1509DRAFT_643520 [Lipomyces kononenkoae]